MFILSYLHFRYFESKLYDGAEYYVPHKHHKVCFYVVISESSLLLCYCRHPCEKSGLSILSI